MELSNIINDYGFMLNEDEQLHIINVILKEQYDADIEGFREYYEFLIGENGEFVCAGMDEVHNNDLFELLDKLPLCLLSQYVDVVCLRLNEDGTDSEDEYSYEPDGTMYFRLTDPSLFKAVYKDIDDAVASVKEQYGKYLPEDYDYKNNLCHIMGVVEDF